MDHRIFFLASYPKSGSTWVRAMVSAYFNFGGLDINKLVATFSDQDNYFLRLVSPVPVEELAFTDRIMLRPAQFMHMEQALPFDPVIVKTHQFNGFVESMQMVPERLTKGAVYIVRDPRDIVASYANHMGLSLDSAIANMADEDNALKDAKAAEAKEMIRSWSAHVTSWMRELPYQVRVLRYEDISQDPVWALNEVLQALGWAVDTKRLQAAVRACEFKRMQKQETDNGFVEQSEKAERFFRKGQVGGWREELTLNQIRQIEESCGETMEVLGYERHAILKATG